MKFLFVSHIFPPAVDGGSKIIAKLEEYFRLHDHQSLILTTPHYSTDDFIRSNSRIKNLESSSNVLRLPVYHLHRRLPKPIFKIIPFFQFLVSSFRFHPDFIIAGPFPTTIPIYALLLKLVTRNCKLIIVPCFHENDADFHQPLLIKTLKSADLVCTLTDHEKLYLTDHCSLLPDHCFVMHAGVDKNFLIPESGVKNLESKNVLFLGNFAAHKGVETLIDAFVLLNSPFSKGKAAKPKEISSLTIAGQKTLYYPKIQTKINSLPPTIKSKIKILPQKYDDQILKKLLDTCSVLVLPSIHESFGLVLIEAMARGKPVIGANIPAVNELISTTGGGLLFKPNNSDDLSQKIITVLENPKKFQNSYQYVKSNFTWDKIGENLWQKISSL